jgi:hypothetical protein
VKHVLCQENGIIQIIFVNVLLLKQSGIQIFLNANALLIYLEIIVKHVLYQENGAHLSVNAFVRDLNLFGMEINAYAVLVYLEIIVFHVQFHVFGIFHQINVFVLFLKQYGMD